MLPHLQERQSAHLRGGPPCEGCRAGAGRRGRGSTKAQPTPLWHAAHGGHAHVCTLLLEAGARLDPQTSDGFTALMVAQQEHPDSAALQEVLSGNGPAYPPGTVCDRCGKTAEQACVDSLKMCGSCDAARYCGAACQTAAWPEHQAECWARVRADAERKKAALALAMPPAEEPAQV